MKALETRVRSLARSFFTPKGLLITFFSTTILASLVSVAVGLITIRQAMEAPGPVVAPMVMASVATPKPFQYENKIRIVTPAKTIPLPVHKGSVDDIAGPVSLVIEAGASITWNPYEDMTDVEPSTKWVFAFSDVDGITLEGANPPPLITLGVHVYFPEVMTFPITIENPSARKAHVTIVTGVDFEPIGGGGGGGNLF